MKAGDRVSVKTSVVVYVHPKHRNQTFETKGLKGNVLSVITDWQGRPLSPNLPIVVDFGNKFKAHFREDELELIE
ncbi:ferredoxin-thioredoxin reductase variable chain [Planktothrix agardhii]|uniref:ferredoxin-thioredoxin reductase variable chain n=1 Tax=Planktothrix agardhii TaxID=1160 RepID=UPI0028AF8FBB|nr:ferredoxin-thioredoxin reductase variable chain [Planktothrix agardhii]